MKLKYLSTNMIIIILISISLLTGYSKSLECPVFADSVTDQWQDVTTNQQLVEAFKYYCKSRDLTIEGSVADAVTKFTTKTFNGLCNTLGIDVTALQAQIKYQTDENIGNRFLFSALGIDAYNRIFSQFLQDNNLEVGDENVNETVQSGRYYIGEDGNSGWVYVYSTSESGSITINYPYNGLTKGSTYSFVGSDMYNISPTSYTLLFKNNETYTLNFSKTGTVGKSRWGLIVNNQDTIYQLNQNTGGNKVIWSGNDGIFYNTRNNKLYYSFVTESQNGWLSPQTFRIYTKKELNVNDSEETSVNIVSVQINNNTYEGDTIINNNGTTGDDGGDDDDDPYDPYPDGGGTITPPSSGGGSGTDGTINFPDFNINLPEINWSLGDLSNKFPFCIPFDMIAFLTLLNAEPQAPHIEGQIPLTSHYTWNLDLDFAQFDTFASIMRGLEFVGFMFFLISATINIVRG